MSGVKLGCFLSSYKHHFYAVDLVRDNLKEVCNLVSDAKPKWYDLGFQLDIKEVALEVIKMENSNNVHACFRKMLSTWLKMIDPTPSWEGLLTALEHDSVNCGDVAESIRQRFGILKQPESEMMSEHSSSPAANTSGSRKYIYTLYIAYRILRGLESSESPLIELQLVKEPASRAYQLVGGGERACNS